MKHHVNMVQSRNSLRNRCTFVSHQQEVGTGYFDDVTTVIQGGSSSVKALTGSTEERAVPLETASLANGGGDGRPSCRMAFFIPLRGASTPPRSSSAEQRKT